MITCAQMRDLVKAKESRLLGICDITCDYEGSIEFLRKFTDSEQPFYTYEPISEAITDGCNGAVQDGILYHAMDFLPCELSYDASTHFGSLLV
jgi:alpha-aminoadipic semialdehyde synthase